MVHGGIRVPDARIDPFPHLGERQAAIRVFIIFGLGAGSGAHRLFRPAYASGAIRDSRSTARDCNGLAYSDLFPGRAPLDSHGDHCSVDLTAALSFFSSHSIEFRQITGFYKGTTFLGERFARAAGKPNPWRYLGDAASALMVVFVADVSVALWRRGSRSRAIIAGGTAIFSCCAAFTTRWRTLGFSTHRS